MQDTLKYLNKSIKMSKFVSNNMLTHSFLIKQYCFYQVYFKLHSINAYLSICILPKHNLIGNI